MAQPGKARVLGACNQSWETRATSREGETQGDSHPLTTVLRSAPILFDFECLRIVLEGNTDSFVIFGGVEQTGLSSFRPAVHP